MFSFKVPLPRQTGVVSTGVSAAVATLARILSFAIVLCNILVIISLCCTIIASAPQAVAFAIPPSHSLMMFRPQANNSRIAISQLKEFPKQPENMDVVLTPGQQVINAVPDNERGDFIMHELAIALQEVEEAETGTGALQRKFFKNLDVIVEHYGNKLTNLKNVPVYKKFPADLLQWFEAKFNLTHQSVYNQFRSRSQLLCTPEGVCYSSQDIGCYCCPF